SINASEQSSRLGEQVYDGYVELSAGQPGTSGLVAIPEPDLSNPAGGAAEPQHLAYVIQWYLFAALPWPRRSSWRAPSAGGSAPSWTTRRPRSRRRMPRRPGSPTATDVPRTDSAGARVCRTSALAAS